MKGESKIPEEKQKEENPLAVEEEKQQLKSMTFSTDQLTGAWEQFAETIKVEKPRIYHIIKASNPVKKDDNIIVCTVKNTLQRDAFEKIEADIIAFISSKLQNNQLKLELNIVEMEQKEQLYTDSDKLRYLTEKNANLNKLKQQFNLDF